MDPHKWRGRYSQGPQEWNGNKASNGTLHCTCYKIEFNHIFLDHKNGTLYEILVKDQGPHKWLGITASNGYISYKMEFYHIF